MIEKLKTFFMKNWKTTLGGLFILIIGILTQAEVMSVELAALITSVLTGLGFVAAKDANQTGV